MISRRTRHDRNIPPIRGRSLGNLLLLLPAVLLLACEGGQVSKVPDGTAAPEAHLSGEALYASDLAPDTLLYDRPREVVSGVWTAVGSMGPRTPENAGHNNNLSFVVTDDGVLLVNAADNYRLAQALHEEIRRITDQPVRYVVLENGRRGHALLGAGYWKEQGATVIAHEDAAREIEANAFDILDRMQRRLGRIADGTTVVLPDETFRDSRVIEMGGQRIELLYLGPANGPGDIAVWLPEKRLVISGDIAFHQRLVPLFEYTDTRAWIETWKRFAALDAKYVIPGHGEPTTMAAVTRDTYDYLVGLREKVTSVVQHGGSLHDAYEVDQSAYADMPTFEFLARRNAGRVYQEMELVGW